MDTTHRTSTDTVTIELPFKPPFDWQRMLDFFERRSSIGVEAIEAGVYRRAVDWEGESGTMAVRLHDDKHCLVATIEGEVHRHADKLIPRMRRMFDLDTDPDHVRATFSADPWLAPMVAATPGLRVPGTWSALELVVRTIVGQQVSVKGATTVMGRIVARAGERIPGHAHDGTAWRFPAALALAQADLAGIGMPTKRIAAIQAVALAVAQGDIPLEDTAADIGTVRQALLAMPGIGPWTVEYVAMRALRDPDAWPASDLVLMQCISRHYPAASRPAQQRVKADAWRPWRAYAALHIWNSLAAETGRVGGG